MANLTRRENVFDGLFDFRRDFDGIFNRLLTNTAPADTKSGDAFCHGAADRSPRGPQGQSISFARGSSGRGTERSADQSPGQLLDHQRRAQK